MSNREKGTGPTFDSAITDAASRLDEQRRPLRLVIVDAAVDIGEDGTLSNWEVTVGGSTLR